MVTSKGTLGTGCAEFLLHPESNVLRNKIKIICTFIAFTSTVYKVMKFRTIIVLFLLLITIGALGCSSTKPEKTPESVEEAEKLMAEKSKQQAKANKKAKKEAEKRYWSMQSKATKKSVKKNKKNQKRLARHYKQNR